MEHDTGIHLPNPYLRLKLTKFCLAKFCINLEVITFFSLQNQL